MMKSSPWSKPPIPPLSYDEQRQLYIAMVLPLMELQLGEALRPEEIAKAKAFIEGLPDQFFENPLQVGRRMEHLQRQLATPEGMSEFAAEIKTKTAKLAEANADAKRKRRAEKRRREKTRRS